MKIESKQRTTRTRPSNKVSVAKKPSKAAPTKAASTKERPASVKASGFKGEAQKTSTPWKGLAAGAPKRAQSQSLWGGRAPRWGKASATASAAQGVKAQTAAKASAVQGVQGSRATSATQLPADLQSKVGTAEYYKAREADFKQRNPGVDPPDYYSNYGDKYAQRFTKELRPKLSPQGQEWLDKTFQSLQQKMENKRKEDPVAFAQMERNPEAFKEFAYGTHPDAYLESGLSKLPASDIAKIAVTPDLKDILTKPGIAQMIDIAPRLAKQWAEQGVKKIGRWLGF